MVPRSTWAEHACLAPVVGGYHYTMIVCKQTRVMQDGVAIVEEWRMDVLFSVRIKIDGNRNIACGQ